jgi:hypothetical protein
MQATIVHMAQTFVGANNVPLLEAAGQFGTRLQVSTTTSSLKPDCFCLRFRRNNTSAAQRVCFPFEVCSSLFCTW